MPKKGMRTIFFKPPPSSPSSTSPPAMQRHTFSDSLMEENIDNAHSLISKWDFHNSSPPPATSLFENRHEAHCFLSSVKRLQSSMQYYISQNPTSNNLIRAQALVQIAMPRLEMEFFQILKTTRDSFFDPDSLSSRTSTVSDELLDDESLTTEKEHVVVSIMDLKAIADCMMSSGYSKECVTVYKIARKSIVDEWLYNAGVEKLTLTQLQRLDWEVTDVKIKNWLCAVKSAVKTFFNGERTLCDHVFSASASIAESCFAETTKEGALDLFGFPENVAKCKKTPEKMFKTLDLYEAIADLLPEIESIFSFESTSTVRSQAVTSLNKLRDAVRTMITHFEAAISKDLSKTPVPGGGIHPLTRYVMNYITFLADYSGVLENIFSDWPLPARSPLPECLVGGHVELETGGSPAVSGRLAWLILVLLCKLDGKAELYKDVAQFYLFLTNNLQYVVNKVRTSSLRLLIGDDWIGKHETKVRMYALNYERMGWRAVIASLPKDLTASTTVDDVAISFERFNTAFEATCEKQSSWVVTDAKLRDEIKVSVEEMIVPVYREFYEKFRIVVRSTGIVKFAPDDLGKYLSDLLFGGSNMQESIPSASSSATSFGSSGKNNV